MFDFKNCYKMNRPLEGRLNVVATRKFTSRTIPSNPFLSRLSSYDWLPCERRDWGRCFLLGSEH